MYTCPSPECNDSRQAAFSPVMRAEDRKAWQKCGVSAMRHRESRLASPPTELKDTPPVAGVTSPLHSLTLGAEVGRETAAGDECNRLITTVKDFYSAVIRGIRG